MKSTLVIDIVYRITRHDGKDFPCLFIPDMPVNYGNVACFDHEGFNEAALGYYRSTRPVKTEAERVQCERLAHKVDVADPSEHTMHREMRRLNYNTLRANWS